MRIANKLYLGFGILLALMVALGALVAYDMVRIRDSLGRLSHQAIPSLTADVRIARNFATETAEAHAYLMSHEEWRLAEARSAAILLQSQLKRAMNAAVTPDLKPIRDLMEDIDSVEAKIRECESLASAGHTREAIAAWNRDVRPPADSISTDLDSLRLRREDRTVQAAEDVVNQGAHLGPVSQIVVLVALLAAVLASAVITRSLLDPIRELVRAADHLGEGDLSARVNWQHTDELGALASGFNRMADRVETTINQLHTTRKALEERNEALSDAYHTIQQEMELAARIQRVILPTDCSHLEILAAADMVAASDIGGDFYDVMPARPTIDDIVLVVGDVSGKGIAAALLMVFVVTILREICRRESDPAVALEGLNQLMRNRFGPDEDMYVTCFVGVLNRSSLEFRFAKAGHEEPIWYHAASGTCEFLKATGLFVGLFANGAYLSGSIQLRSGDRLVLYTDGIVEARDRQRQQFSANRLCEVVARNGAASSTLLIEKIKAEVEDWTGSSFPHDDMTLLVVEIP